MAKLKAGQQWRSGVCTTEIIVIAAGDDDLELTCGGSAMVDKSADAADGGTIAADASGGTQLGKRYVDAGGTIEILCTKPGDGSLAINGTSLQLKGAKPLPSSD